MFGQKLRDVREKAGLTQASLAKKIGLSRIQVVRLEADQSKPSWATVQEICSTFKLSCDHFMERPPK